MIKIRSLLVFVIIPIAAGYLYAGMQAKKTVAPVSSDFDLNAVLLTDNITFIHQGDIVSLTHTQEKTIPTHNPALIEACPLGNKYLAINKQLNYSSLEEFDKSGQKIKTLLNGDTGNIDTMNWYTDPTCNTNQQKIAFVSDKDKDRTNVQDNALFIEDLTANTITSAVKPAPHSGGITHPIWNPTDQNMIAYDFYQYDTQTLDPYSVIMTYDTQTKVTNSLTIEKQNAYQAAFSPNGKQLIFLGRNEDNIVTMYLATITTIGLTQLHSIAVGDFAYPIFSNTPNHIYYLEAHGNSGYDLYQATIKNNNLTNILAVTTNASLLANSGFNINKGK